mgnify:CR=1 FL=1
MAIRKPVIRGDIHVPKVVPTVKYALEIRLNAEIFIEVNCDSFNYKKLTFGIIEFHRDNKLFRIVTFMSWFIPVNLRLILYFKMLLNVMRVKFLRTKNRFIFLSGLITMLISQDVFEGYTLFTPGEGGGGGEVVWEWHLWDHLIQDVDSGDDNYGVVFDHPELFDINLGNIGGGGGPGGANADWIHLNAISYNADFDQIVISNHHHDEIFIIDHGTTTEEAAGHSGGNYGKGGDFLYRWGNPQNYDRGNNSYHIIGSQHSINWIPEGSPGAGNFILFNNEGNEALEFAPPVDENGNYFLEEGQPFGPSSETWTSPYMSTPMQGGAFRLPNGNTLITQTHTATVIEVDSEGNELWSFTHEGENSYWIARSEKNSPDYLIDIILGDLNGDGTLNILDIVILANLILDQ